MRSEFLSITSGELWPSSAASYSCCLRISSANADVPALPSAGRYKGHLFDLSVALKCREGHRYDASGTAFRTSKLSTCIVDQAFPDTATHARHTRHPPRPVD
jgi:hypothetical protein